MAKVLTDSKNYEDIADAIRSKGVSGTFKPSEMADAIESIPSGTDFNLNEFLIELQLLPSTRSIYPETLNLSLPHLKQFTHMYLGYNSSEAKLYSNPGFKHLIIRDLNPNIIYNLSDAITYQYDLISIDLGEKLIVSSMYIAFRFCTNLETITTEFDCSNVLSTGQMNAFGNCNKLKDIRFTANTIKISTPIQQSSQLSDASLVSIANGLNESVSGQSLTLHATPKAKLSTIMGTVTMDSTNTFHIFTADGSGTTSLADFIVNTKGWAIA